MNSHLSGGFFHENRLLSDRCSGHSGSNYAPAVHADPLWVDPYPLGLATTTSPKHFTFSHPEPEPVYDSFYFLTDSRGTINISISNDPAPPLLWYTELNSAKLYSATGANPSNPFGVNFNIASAAAIGNEIRLTSGIVNAGEYIVSVFGSTNGQWGGYYNGTISVTAVPEPETYAMLLAGLGVVGFAARRRNKVGNI